MAPAKLERCVEEVSGKGGAVDPWAVCQASVMGKGMHGRKGHHNPNVLWASPGVEISGTHSRNSNPSPNSDATKYQDIALNYSKGKIDEWQRKQASSGRIYAQAWLAEDDGTYGHDIRIVTSPNVTSADSLYVFLHEVAHHEFGHPDKGCAVEAKGMCWDSYHEYQATKRAFDVMRDRGVEIPKKTVDDAVWAIEQHIKQEEKSGLRIKPEVQAFVSKYKENPSWRQVKRGLDIQGYLAIGGSGYPVHSGEGVSKAQALKFAKEARKEGEKGVRVIKAKDYGKGVYLREDEKDPLGVKAYRNPADTSSAMYASFHGKPSSETVEVEEQEHYHGNLAELGVLVELGVRTVTGLEVWLGFEEGEGDAETNPKHLRNVWPFGPGQLLGSREYVYHLKGKGSRTRATKTSTATVYKGYRITPSEYGFVVPRIDPDSSWDSLKIAKRVIDDHVKRNPRGKGGPVSSAIGYVSKIAGDLDRRLGKAIGFKRNPGGYVLYWNGVYSSYIPTLESAKKQAKEKAEKYGYKVHVVDAETNKTVETYDSTHKRRNPSPDPLSTSTVLLCSNESGTQLFFVGGDQSLDLDELKFSPAEQDKESLVIGECFFVSYLTQKEFDNFEIIVYEHDLGEETGVVPSLIYDRVNQKMMLAGGEYHIEQPLLETSPGIKN